VDQDFALVVAGDLARPGAGSVLVDRGAYTAPGGDSSRRLRPARAASNTVSLLLMSASEPRGDLPAARIWQLRCLTGAVATVVGLATVDGNLQLHHGDAIQADYVDSSGTLRVANATADLLPPTSVA